MRGRGANSKISKDVRKGEARLKTLFFHLMPTWKSMGGDADHRNVRYHTQGRL